jgi:cytochrome P450/CRP-like cAMP-binding protein
MPLLGNALQVLTSPLESLLAAYNQLGPVFRVAIPGREIVVLAGPEANALLAQHEDEYFASAGAYANLASEAGTRNYPQAVDGEAHAYLRRTLRPAYSREVLGPYLPQIAESVRKTARAWQPGQQLKVMAFSQRMLMEQLSLAMANHPLDGHYNDATAFSNTFVGVGLALHPTAEWLLPTYQIAKRRFDGFMKQIVAEHRDARPAAGRRPDMVDALLSMKGRDGRPFAENDLAAYTHLPYVNSFTYVARVFGFMLYALLKHPDLLKRVTDEVDATFAAGVPDASTLRKMKVLRGVVMETLRIYPVALAVLRIASADLDFGGYTIPKGQFLIIGTSVMHFLPEIYADPFTFDIERYNPPRSEHQQTGAFAPFGLGTHICLSAGLVETMLMLCASSLLHTVRLELTSPDYELEIGITPLRAPSDRFAVRVVEQRTAQPVAAVSPLMLDEELSLILPGADKERLGGVIAALERHTYRPGDVIIRQGDEADRFYLISKGAVEVVREEPGKPPQVVAELGGGQYFGEIGLLQASPRMATVRVPSGGGDVEVMSLDRATFLGLVSESDLTSAEISRMVRQRTMGTTLAVTLPTLDHKHIARLLPRLEMLSFAPGETIIRQGDPADRFYVILGGQVDVLARQPQGQEIHLATLAKGDYFGEIGLLQGKPRNATVRVSGSPAEVMALDRDAFASLIDESQSTGDEIMGVMVRRLESLESQ